MGSGMLPCPNASRLPAPSQPPAVRSPPSWWHGQRGGLPWVGGGSWLGVEVGLTPWEERTRVGWSEGGKQLRTETRATRISNSSARRGA